MQLNTLIHKKHTSMKKFINESTEIIKDGSLQKHDFKSLALVCMDYVNPQSGISIIQMEKELEVIKKIKESKQEIVLEDSQYDILVRKVNSYPWLGIHEDVIKFSNALKNAEKVS